MLRNTNNDKEEMEERIEELEEENNRLEGESFEWEDKCEDLEEFSLPHGNLADELKAKFLLEQFEKYTEDELRNLLTK